MMQSTELRDVLSMWHSVHGRGPKTQSRPGGARADLVEPEQSIILSRAEQSSSMILGATSAQVS